MKEADRCLNCVLFKEKQEQILATCDSIFDAAYDLTKFTDECKETCNKQEEQLTRYDY